MGGSAASETAPLPSWCQPVWGLSCVWTVAAGADAVPAGSVEDATPDPSSWWGRETHPGAAGLTRDPGPANQRTQPCVRGGARKLGQMLALVGAAGLQAANPLVQLCPKLDDPPKPCYTRQ